MPPTQVNVKFQTEGTEGLDTKGGLVTEMCPTCYALAPTDKIQEHIDSAHPPAPPEEERPERPEPPSTVNPLPS